MPRFLSMMPEEGETTEAFAARVASQIDQHFSDEDPVAQTPVEETTDASEVQETSTDDE